MDVFTAIQTRKSVRAYLDRPVEEEKLNAIFEAARLAPSASNRQEWRFVLVRQPEARQQLAEIAGSQHFIAEAPIVIVACAETDGRIMRCGQACYPIDVAIALDHITLAATALGLGTCWIGHFDEERVKAFLGIPPQVRVIELMPLGYPVDPAPIEKNRQPLANMVKYERW